MFHVSIPSPCHEDWNKMSPREQGAFCEVCSKTVVDFTALSDEQVKNYLLQNSGQKTCGRFRNDQLTANADYLPKLLATKIPLWKKFLAALVILFGGLLTGCDGPMKGKVDAGNSIQSALGETDNSFFPVRSTDSNAFGKGSEIIKTIYCHTPKIIFSTPTITGDIAIEPPPPIVGELVMDDPIDIMGISELEPDTADTIPMRVVDFCLDEEVLPLSDSLSNKISKQDSLQKKTPKKDSVKYYLDPE